MTCEHCGELTSDWRDTGWFCSEACLQAEILLLVASLNGGDGDDGRSPAGGEV